MFRPSSLFVRAGATPRLMNCRRSAGGRGPRWAAVLFATGLAVTTAGLVPAQEEGDDTSQDSGEEGTKPVLLERTEGELQRDHRPSRHPTFSCRPL
jgi:hypothetical protein